MSSRVTIDGNVYESSGSIDVQRDAKGDVTVVSSPPPEPDVNALVEEAVRQVVEYLKDCKAKGIKP